MKKKDDNEQKIHLDLGETPVILNPETPLMFSENVPLVVVNPEVPLDVSESETSVDSDADTTELLKFYKKRLSLATKGIKFNKAECDELRGLLDKLQVDLPIFQSKWQAFLTGCLIGAGVVIVFCREYIMYYFPLWLQSFGR